MFKGLLDHLHITFGYLWIYHSGKIKHKKNLFCVEMLNF